MEITSKAPHLKQIFLFAVTLHKMYTSILVRYGNYNFFMMLYRAVSSNLLNQRTRNFSVYMMPRQLRFPLLVRTRFLLERHGIWRSNISSKFLNKKFLSSLNKK
jgi:hypothetical protein